MADVSGLGLPRALNVAEQQRIDDELRPLLHGMWSFDTAPAALLRLGPPALERLLDAPDSVFWPTDMEWRDYGSTRQHGIAAFAKQDLAGVLAAMKRRKWPAVRVALSGIALVQEARVVPFLVRACGDAGAPVRAKAVEYLGLQRDPLATAAVVRALRDRSSDVRVAAIRALGSIGDPQSIEPLEATVARNLRSPVVASEVKQALQKIRASRKARGA